MMQHLLFSSDIAALHGEIIAGDIIYADHKHECLAAR